MTHLFAEPIDAELEGVQPQAARLAAIMGLVAGVAVEAPTARWRITDTSAAEFGQEVATDLFLSPATGGARSSVALASLRESCSARTERQARSLGGGQACGSMSRSTPGRARSGQRGLGNEPRRCSGELPTRDLKEMNGWPHEGPRATLEVLHTIHGLEGHTYHLSLVAATTWGPLRSGSVLGTQTLVSNFGPRSAIRTSRRDRRRLPGAGHLALGDDRAGGQAQPESSFLCGVAPHNRARFLREVRVTTKDFSAYMAEIAETEARTLKQNRLLLEEIGLSSKVDGSGTKKQDT